MGLAGLRCCRRRSRRWRWRWWWWRGTCRVGRRWARLGCERRVARRRAVKRGRVAGVGVARVRRVQGGRRRRPGRRFGQRAGGLLGRRRVRGRQLGDRRAGPQRRRGGRPHRKPGGGRLCGPAAAEHQEGDDGGHRHRRKPGGGGRAAASAGQLGPPGLQVLSMIAQALQAGPVIGGPRADAVQPVLDALTHRVQGDHAATRWSERPRRQARPMTPPKVRLNRARSSNTDQFSM